MLSAVSLVQDSLKSKRNTEHFEAIFREAEDKCDNLSLGPIVPPRTHRPPKRFSGQASAYTPETAVDFYRPEFYRILDTVDAQITEGFMLLDGNYFFNQFCLLEKILFIFICVNPLFKCLYFCFHALTFCYSFLDIPFLLEVTVKVSAIRFFILLRSANV